MSQEETGFNDHPIITYSNRIQKHLFELTRELSLNNSVEMTEKRKLKLIIANLPPIGKEKLKKIIERLESQTPITTIDFDKMYGEVSDWIYTNILQDAFKARPLYQKKGHLTIPESKQ